MRDRVQTITGDYKLPKRANTKKGVCFYLIGEPISTSHIKDEDGNNLILLQADKVYVICLSDDWIIIEKDIVV